MLELAPLALTGATTLVAAIATDAWQVARTGVARLFRRRDQVLQSAIEAQLQGNATLVAQAEDAEQARQALIPMWQLELKQLLRQHPDAADELQALINEISAAMPQTQRTWAQKVQTNIAKHGSQVIAAQDGNVIVHQAPISRQRPPIPGTTSDDTGDGQ
ncbi:hypothetical protein ACFWA4_30285 [Streptomyces sp. NPDC060011]|uniref:hypothetical protein n=1 Tax=Streptomyces sp. NPDC060011 TaxID=3347037 RepID=UPI0036A2AD18